MLDDDHVKSSAEVGRAKARAKWSVDRMGLEEVLLRGERLGDRLTRNSVLLGAAHNTDVSEPERIHLALNDIDAVGPFVHQVNFREDANRTITCPINSVCQLEGV